MSQRRAAEERDSLAPVAIGLSTCPVPLCNIQLSLPPHTPLSLVPSLQSSKPPTPLLRLYSLSHTPPNSGCFKALTD